MRAFADEMLAGGFGSNSSSSAPWPNSSCAAMHIRRTDKFRGRRREDARAQVGFAGFSRAFKSWAFWHAPVPAAQLGVLIGSEDPKTFGAMPPLLAPARSFWIASRHFVFSSFKSINDHNANLAARYEALKAAARASGGGDAAAQKDVKDEGMALVLQVLLMARCDAFFGSYASNVAVVVHDLMHARSIAAGTRLHAIDVNGRTYCGCGASFCMKIERRAAREPRRSIRSMVDAMRGDNIRAI
jgi:hypothetical protein